MIKVRGYVYLRVLNLVRLLISTSLSIDLALSFSMKKDGHIKQTFLSHGGYRICFNQFEPGLSAVATVK